ncbi:hypothetical protein EWM64_g2282 [Hericium alpestre]|uniref:Uncharacterized protein n=1 Tax=Hericium alpestre TaxID=135208 RepID=A0A4Z0A5R1_9AGAM|nr:hypothetical protein EWM64_g2282 [Hericium alpestre]
MSSLQISQAGPASVAGAPSHVHVSQSQKALLKGPKARGTRSAAASSGHKRTLKDDVSYRQIQASWGPFPPDARATTSKEDDVMVRAVADHIRQTRALGEQMYNEKYGDAERRVSELRAIVALRQRSVQLVENIRRDREQYMQGPLLELIATAPDEEMRRLHQEALDMYRGFQREDELRHGR